MQGSTLRQSGLGGLDRFPDRDADSSKQITIGDDRVGDVKIGGDAPIVVQSMTCTDTADVKDDDAPDPRAGRARLRGRARRGAGQGRPRTRCPRSCANTPVPLIADIHFDYRWALAAIRAGFHGLRLNPGNIRDVDKVKTVVKEAKERGIPIRIGVNAGSLPPIPRAAGRRAAADAWSTAWSTPPSGRSRSSRTWTTTTSRSR